MFFQWKDKFPERQIGFAITDWDKDRELDGFLCRNHRDCRWADPQFDCQQYQIDIEFLKVKWIVYNVSCLIYITYTSRTNDIILKNMILNIQGTWKGWTNGTRSNIAGECACRSGFHFDDFSLSCQEATFQFNPIWLIVAFAILILILLLCCRFGICCIFKE